MGDPGTEPQISACCWGFLTVNLEGLVKMQVSASVTFDDCFYKFLAEATSGKNNPPWLIISDVCVWAWLGSFPAGQQAAETGLWGGSHEVQPQDTATVNYLLLVSPSPTLWSSQWCQPSGIN